MSRLLALLGLPLCLGTAWAQEVLPVVDPPDAVKALARHTGDFRKDHLNQSLKFEYRTAAPAWKLVHACLLKDAGKINALKVAYSRDVRQTRTAEKWKQYEVLIQAFHLHHAKLFRDYLRDDLLQVAMLRENDDFPKYPDGIAKLDHESATFLLSGACAAALYPKETLQYTHACVHKSLDRFRTLEVDLEDSGDARVIAINAILQCALVTGRLGEFRNESWRRVFDDLRDLIPPNGVPPRFGEVVHNDVFDDWSAALRIGAVLFGDGSYAYAANKYQAARQADPAQTGSCISPVQWSFINYPSLDKLPHAPPKVLSVVQRSYAKEDDDMTKVILRTGHHPRAAFAMIDSRGAIADLWAGGSRLAPRQQENGGTPEVATESAVTENKGGDAYGKITSKSRSGEPRHTRRMVLTREGILIIADEYAGDSSASGHAVGPVWSLGKTKLASGSNWFACESSEHFLPNGYHGDPRSALVWFAPQEGATVGEKSGTAFQTAKTGGRPMRFLTVVVPFKKGLKPGAVAAAISAEALTEVTIGKVTIALGDTAWTVNGNGRR